MAERSVELDRLLASFRRGEIGDEELLDRLARLDGLSRGDAEPVPRTGGSRTDASVRDGRERVVERLDAYRAAERSGAETLAAWAELSDDAALVGGLRTAAAREEKHAALLEQRLRELGGAPRAQIPEAIARYNAALADPTASDLERLGLLVGRFPDIDAAVAPLTTFIDSIEDDDLTRELLRTICVDELATLRWAHDAYLRRREGAQ